MQFPHRNCDVFAISKQSAKVSQFARRAVILKRIATISVKRFRNYNGTIFELHNFDQGQAIQTYGRSAQNGFSMNIP